MFGRKKETKPKAKENRDLSQYGLFGLSKDFDDNNDEDSGGADSDLEAELAAIASGGYRLKRKSKQTVPAVDLDRMVAESLRDIGSDEELSDDDDNTDIMNELSEIVEENSVSDVETDFVSTSNITIDNVELLKSRIRMYEIAESNAKQARESSKTRRFNRGLKTLKELLRSAENGKTINLEDIPPEVSTKPIDKARIEPEIEQTTNVLPITPVLPQEPVSSTSAILLKEEHPMLDVLQKRQQEYKIAALGLKKTGDTAKALIFVKIAKQFDLVISAVKNGEEVDLSNMPPSPSEYKDDDGNNKSDIKSVVQETTSKDTYEIQKSSDEQFPEPELEPALIIGSTVDEALHQRLDKYISVEKTAKDEGNSSKARRFGRIVKQYEDAIKLHKAGKPVAFDELPCPPGFGPLPLANNNAISAKSNTPEVSTPKEATNILPFHSENNSKVPTPALRRPQLQKQDSRVMGNHVNTYLMEKQIIEIKQRQKEFREAALNAKKAGDLEHAKEYLRNFKGLEKMLEAAEGGFPVDMTTLPIPPSLRINLEDSFILVNDTDCDENGTDSELYKRLEDQLHKQLAICKTTRDHLRAVGDVPGTNRFENLALGVQKDLDILRLASKNNLPIPKFHYKMESFNIIRCHTDLTDNQVDIGIIRGINYNVSNPKDVDTYVKMEFPYPIDDYSKVKTAVVKNTDNPEYNENIIVDIQRSSRSCQRVFKNKSVKLEVYSKGSYCTFPYCKSFSGFLRSDTLIGTVNVKLQPLETTIEIHNSFDLMDGRKKIGGKLEVKLRVRRPIIAQQMEQINEKWLIIDH